MKIGFFTDSYLPQLNGVATSVDVWARTLEKLGHTVYIIAPRYPGYKDARKRVIRLTSLKLWRQPEIRLAIYPTPKTILKISKLNLDIIHGLSGGSISTLGLIVARLKKIPFVFTYYTRWNHYTHYILEGKLVSPKMAERVSRVFCNKCDCITVPMQKIKDELVSFGVKKPITVIQSGVDLDKFAKQNIESLSKITGIKKRKILLYVGRLSKEKSVDFLLKAFQLIKIKNPRSHLVLVGDGPDKGKLKKLSQRLHIEKNVHFTGLVNHEEINKVYKHASVFVFASQTETQGIVILEALASGLPIVAVADEVFDGVLKDKINSVLVERNEEQFAKACLAILNNNLYREKLSKNAYKIAYEFSVSKTAREFERLYQMLIYSKNKNLFYGGGRWIDKWIRAIERYEKYES